MEKEKEGLESEVLDTESKTETNASLLEDTQEVLNDLALEALENSPMKEKNTEEVATLKEEPTLIEKESKKKNRLPIILLVLVAIAAIAFGVYYFFPKKDLTPKEQYVKVLNDAYASASSYLTNDIEYDFTKPFALKLNASIDTTMDELKDLSGYHLQAGLGFDMEGKKGSLDLSIQDKNKKDILSAQAGLDDKNIYIASEKLFDKTIKVSNVTTEFWNSLNGNSETLEIHLPENMPTGKDIDHFIKLIKDTIINNISDDTIKTSEDKITIDGKEETVTKLSYTLDQKETEKQLTAIVTAIKNDETSMNLIATMKETDKTEVETMLDEMLGNIEVDTPATFDLYVKNNDLVQLDFSVLEGDVLRYTVNDKKSNLVLIEDGETEFEVNINKENKKQTLVTIDIPEQLNVKLTVREYSNNKADMDYTITLIEEDQTVTGTINVTANKDKLSGTYSVATTVAEKEVKVNMEVEVTPNVPVTLPATTNAVEYTSLTQTDMTTIMTNLQNVMQETGLDTIISSFMGSGDIQM